MAERFGRFRTPEAADHYYRMYDDIVIRHWPVPSTEIDVPTSFGPTRVRRSGPDRGIPLVMLHPTSGSSLGWRTLIGSLAAMRTVFTPDTIGTAGRSVQEAPIRSAIDLSRWLDEVLDTLALDRVHLCGYSEGGWIAAVHAAGTGHDDRIATLILIEPGGAIERVPRRFLVAMILRAIATMKARDKRRAIRKFSRWLNGEVELTDDEVDLVVHVFGSFRQRLPSPGRFTDEQLRRLKAPTLLILGADTKLFDPGAVADRARRLLPNVTVDITPNAGHGVAFQNPARTSQQILDFIEANEPTEPPGGN